MNHNLTVDALIAKLQEEIEEVDLSGINANTIILEIEGWNSLHSLIMMALASTEYGTELTAQDIRVVKTIQDLCNIINERRS